MNRLKLSKNYIKQKRSEVDYCNICGERRKLTWDHVPPKSVLMQNDVLANTAFEGIPTESSHMRHYQSGIKYRTICAECNNVVIGKNDVAYKQFISDIIIALAKTAQTGIQTIDQSIIVKARINRVLRAICGHFLAMKQDYDNRVITDKDMRRYVLDETLVFENNRLYCWLYPYSTILNSRDFVVRGYHKHTHPVAFISVMSAFPLAYVLSSEDAEDCWLDDLGHYSTRNIDDEIEIKLNFQTTFLSGSNQYKHFQWPMDISEKQTGAMFVLGNGEIMEGSRLGIRR